MKNINQAHKNLNLLKDFFLKNQIKKNKIKIKLFLLYKIIKINLKLNKKTKIIINKKIIIIMLSNNNQDLYINFLLTLKNLLRNIKTEKNKQKINKFNNSKRTISMRILNKIIIIMKYLMILSQI